jgi:hypothetical protein
MAGLNIWFVNNAGELLKTIVASKSEGKLRLELSKVSFNFLTRRIQIREGDLISTDSVSRPSTYHVKFRKVTIRVHSFWPLLFQNKLLLDSVKLHDPEIEVVQWRKDTSASLEDITIARAMGKVYNSMVEGLEVFGIKRIIINNAKFSLVNKMKPGSEPVTVSNIYFNLNENENPDENDKHGKSVELTTTAQDIALPGGRHRLAFRTLNLHLFRQRIEMDSCTITATTTDSSKSSYVIFFDKLFLVGVDFGAMYSRNLIRVDSVYCVSPLFNLDLYRSDAVSRKKERPDLEKIVRELSGDLDFAFVGVKDAGIRLNITGSKKRSLSNARKDNFEIRGLRVSADSSVPVSVKQFDMLVQDYQLFNNDSSVSFTFDSVRFANRKIILNNFTVLTAPKHFGEHNSRDFRIPYFELGDLDWYELVFEQNLKAHEAILYDPVINFTKTKIVKNKKRTRIFASLQNLDSLVTLDKLGIVNGRVDMNMGNGRSLLLENVNLSLNTNKLLESTDKESLRRAVDILSFSNGVLKMKDMTVQMQDVNTTRDNRIYAGGLSISSPGRDLDASMRGVFIDNMRIDDNSDTILMDGLKWESGVLNLRSTPSSKKKDAPKSILINNLAGSNTLLTVNDGNSSISTYILSIRASSFSKNGTGPVQTKDLFLSGNTLTALSKNMKIRAGSYRLNEGDTSFLADVRVERILPGDTMSLDFDRISFTTDINRMMNGDIHLGSLDLQSPQLTVHKIYSAVRADPAVKSPAMRIDRITVSSPGLNISTQRNDSVTTIYMPGAAGGIVKASDLVIDSNGIRLGSMTVSTDALTMIKTGGNLMGVEKGKVEIDISDLKLSSKNGRQHWSALVNVLNLKNPKSISMGAAGNQLQVGQVSLGNLSLNSEYAMDFKKLLKYNISAWLRTTSGRYSDSTTTLSWLNAEYSYAKKTLSLDSFSYHPTRPRDTVIARTPYQTDYITFRSGGIVLKGFDLEKYENDSSFFANVLEINNPVITVYRDKRPPFRGGIIKPLPVAMIRKVAMPLSIGSVKVVNGWLSYTETNPKSGAAGTIYLTRLNAGISNIKNRNIQSADSLRISIDTYIMDSALMKLRVSQSYTDPQGAFVMTVQIRPASLTFLNPIITPLSNVKITSGNIDSMHLRAICRDHVSYGRMQMYYHNLHIKLVKDGDPEKSPFLSDMLSFLANKLVVKTNNRGRAGVIYFERLRDRSFFNYLVKTTLSGLGTSTGVNRNSKFRKEYRQRMRGK